MTSTAVSDVFVCGSALYSVLIVCIVLLVKVFANTYALKLQERSDALLAVLGFSLVATAAALGVVRYRVACGQ
jgi:hypothetical protein